MRRSLSGALVCSAIATLAGCASNGGSSSTPGPGPLPDPVVQPAPVVVPVPVVPPAPVLPPTASFETAEYNQMGGHAMIKAAPVYAAGATGAGQTVVVADSGVHAAHPDLAGRINGAAGWDYIKDAAFDGTDTNGHGTHVAGIIASNKNDVGTHGVAFNATIVPMRIVSDGLIVTSDAMLADMAKRSAAAGAVAVNNSWGSKADVRALPNARATFAQFTAEALKAGQKGVVFVWSASNEGGDNATRYGALPDQIRELQPYWLTVAAVDPGSGAIASFSNRCGYAAAWCLSAPGVYIDSTAKDGGYNLMSGTSMATPYVSGSIALLASYFKTLDGPAIAKRLLATADKSGVYADQSIYGQGLLDLEAAMQPVGGLSVPTGMTTTGAVAEMRTAAITVPAGTVEQVRRALGEQTVLVVDNFQRAPFYVKAASLVQERGRSSTDWAGQGNGLSAQPVAAAAVPGMSFTVFSNRAADSPTQGMTGEFMSGQSTVRMGYGAHAAWSDVSFLSAHGSPHLTQFVRGGDPLSMSLQNFAGASYLVGQDMRLTGQFASLVSGSRYNVGIEKRFGLTKLGLTSSIQSGLPEAIAFGAGKAGSGHSVEMYASRPLAEGVHVMGAMGFGQSKMGASMGEWRLEGDRSRSFVSVGTVLASADARSRLGMSYRVEKRSQDGMSVRLPVEVAASGALTYQTVSLDDGQGGRRGALGLFYEADGAYGNLVLGLTAAREGSGAWLGMRRAF